MAHEVAVRLPHPVHPMHLCIDQEDDDELLDDDEVEEDEEEDEKELELNAVCGNRRRNQLEIDLEGWGVSFLRTDACLSGSASSLAIHSATARLINKMKFFIMPLLLPSPGAAWT